MVDDDTELKDSVQRLHRFVVDVMRTRSGDPFARPVSVAEIYQDIAPYRAVRSTLGFEMNADYEHALVRMLAGVDGLTRLDPPKARDRLRKELESPNPDVTLYREYAACDVILNPPSANADWVREQLDEEPVQETTVPKSAPDWSALTDLSTAHHFEEEDERRNEEEPHSTGSTWTDTQDAQTDALAELEAHSARETDAGMAINDSPAASKAPAPAATPAKTPLSAESHDVAHCTYCDSKLPGGRHLRFCPFCGADQSMHPCPSCGEPLAPEWAFCIACGTAVASGN